MAGTPVRCWWASDEFSPGCCTSTVGRQPAVFSGQGDVVVRWLVVVAVALGVLVVVLIVANARDPYGGPIEPSAPH